MPGPRHNGNVPYNPFNPDVWKGLSPEAQYSYWQQLTAQQQQQLQAALGPYNQYTPPDPYNDQSQQAFADALGGYFGGLFGGSSGGGGRGGGSGGGGPAIDYGPDLGLARDRINANRSQLDSGHGFDLQGQMLQQGLLNLQTGAAKRGHGIDVSQLLGSQAARGANTTAGAQTQQHNLNLQFADLMKQLGFQGDQLGLQRNQSNANYMYGVQGNNFDQQALNTQAGNAGYQNPFSIPAPVPVQKKV